MLTQFVAAFDDIVIGRFNKERKEKDAANWERRSASKRLSSCIEVRRLKTSELTGNLTFCSLAPARFSLEFSLI